MKPCIKSLETAAYVKIEKIALKGFEPGGCSSRVFMANLKFGEIEDSQKCK